MILINGPSIHQSICCSVYQSITLKFRSVKTCLLGATIAIVYLTNKWTQPLIDVRRRTQKNDKFSKKKKKHHISSQSNLPDFFPLGFSLENKAILHSVSKIQF